MDLGLGRKAAIVTALLAVVGQPTQSAIAAETVFLQDGRTTVSYTHLTLPTKA